MTTPATIHETISELWNQKVPDRYTLIVNPYYEKLFDEHVQGWRNGIDVIVTGKDKNES